MSVKGKVTVPMGELFISHRQFNRLFHRHRGSFPPMRVANVASSSWDRATVTLRT